jgi:hypothetical protein
VLTALTRQVRLWAASFLVASYAFGLLAPAIAFSFDRDASIIHSLEEAHGGLLLLHVHHDDRDQTKSSQQGPHVGHHCCGVFALQALSAPYIAYLFHEFCGPLINAEPQDLSPLRKSSRLDRPPRITV